MVLFAVLFVCPCFAAAGTAKADTNQEGLGAPLPKSMVIAFGSPAQEDAKRPAHVANKVSWAFGFPMKQETRTIKIIVDPQRGQRSAHDVFAGKPMRENSWAMTIALAAIMFGVGAVSVRSQRNDADDIRLLAFYAGILDIIMAIIISDALVGTVMGSVVVAIAAVIAFSLISALDVVGGIVIVAASAAVVPFMYFGQGVDYLQFVALMIAANYGMAKLAKMLFWSYVPAAAHGGK